MGHQREITHEDLLLLDLAGLLVVQAHPHLHGSGIRGVPRFALLHIVLGLLIHAVINEAQLQIAGIVRDGSHVGEHLTQTGLQEPLVGLLLDLQQVGHRHDFFVSGKILAQGLAVVFVLGHSTITPFYCFFISDPVRPRQSRSGPLRGGSAATRTGLLAIFASLPLYSAARDGILWSDASGGVCAHLPNISALLYQNLDGLSSLYRAPGRFFSAQIRCPIGKTREKQGTPLRCTLFFVRPCPCHPLRDCSGAYAGPPPRRRVCVHAGGSPAYAGVPPERGVYVSIKKGGIESDGQKTP